MLTARGSTPFTAEEAEAVFAPLENEPALLLAVSGGPDSTALLVFAAEWRGRAPERRPRLLAATVDHRWRAESRREAEEVAALCRETGIPHTILTVDSPPPETGLEAAAREARYALLLEHCRREKASLVTAHTLDDQAETVLLRLAAGSGPAGLAAMRPLMLREDVKHVRPLLEVPKARLVAALAERTIPFAVDPTNEDERLARGRLRQSTHVLEREGLSTERLGVLARRMARMEAAVEAMVGLAADRLGLPVEASEEPITFSGATLLDLPEEIALRLVGRCIKMKASGPVKLAALERLFDAVQQALEQKTTLARTLAGAQIVVFSDAKIYVRRAPGRRAPSRSRNPTAS